MGIELRRQRLCAILHAAGVEREDIKKGIWYMRCMLPDTCEAVTEAVFRISVQQPNTQYPLLITQVCVDASFEVADVFEALLLQELLGIGAAAA